jgi:hypothetical protein
MENTRTKKTDLWGQNMAEAVIIACCLTIIWMVL